MGDLEPTPSWSAPAQPPLPWIFADAPLSEAQLLGLLLTRLSEGERIRIVSDELHDGNAPRRLLAVLTSLAWAPIRGDHWTSSLVPLLRHARGDVAAAAARAATAGGDQRLELLYVSLLREGGDIQRQEALLAGLATLAGPRAVEPLSQALTSPSAALRLMACRCLGRAPAAPTAVAQALEPCLRDTDPRIQAAAAANLWTMGSLSALPLLLKLLEDPATEARVAAATALSSLPSNLAVPALLGRLARERTGDGLRALVLSLRRLLKATTLPTDERERVLTHLVRLAETPSVSVQVQAFHLAGLLGTVAEDWLLSALRNNGPAPVVATQIAALAGAARASRLLLVTRFANHADCRVRANLMAMLAREGLAATPYLAQGLADPSPRVRATAATSLWHLGQLDVLGLLTRMLAAPNLPEISAGVHALNGIFRHPPWPNDAQSPLVMGLRRMQPRPASATANLPEILGDPGIVELLLRLAAARGDERIEFLRQAMAANPAQYAPRRMLAHALQMRGEAGRALTLLEDCRTSHPDIFADQLERYRLALLTGDVGLADMHGQMVRNTYQQLLAACAEDANRLGGPGGAALQTRLHRLRQPSLNLYSVMVQLKVAQGDDFTALTLLAELFFSRPDNRPVIDQLLQRLPPSATDLHQALTTFARAIGT